MSYPLDIRVILLSVWTSTSVVGVLGAPLSSAAIHRHWTERQNTLDIITPQVHSLTKEELILDRYLSYLKQIETDIDLLTQPIENSLDDILQTDLFQILRPMPKGGNMHIHENHMLSRRLLLDLIWQSDDFPYLYILPEDHPTRPLEMDFFIVPPYTEPWIKVKDDSVYNREYLVRELNYVDKLKTANRRPSSFDSRRRWRDTSTLWSAFSKVISNVKIKIQYIEALIQTSLAEGVQYLELKKSFGAKERLYELDGDYRYEPTHGKKYLEETAGIVEIPLVKSIMERMKSRTAAILSADNSVRFSGMKRLVQSVRHLPEARVHGDVVRAIELHKLHPDHIAGFDLAGEEDTGFTNFYHSESLLKAADYSRETNNAFRIVSHAGETAYDTDIRFRPGADSQTFAGSNVLDAILLNSSRIGHGLSVIKHPELMDMIKKRDIAIEVCPACNHILGFIPDPRNHPSAIYHKTGIPIVLGSDAHGVIGSEYFTVDWYMVYVAWGIGLADLKQFAFQSLVYSAMNETEKEAAIADWRVSWDHYVTSVVSTVCSTGTGSDAKHLDVSQAPTASYVIPAQIPRWALEPNGTVDFHIHGEDFSSGICEDLLCKVDDTSPVVAVYVTSQHLVCRLRASSIQEAVGQGLEEKLFDVFIAFDQHHFIKVNQTVVITAD